MFSTNGLTNAWLSSSLQISPQEQIEFLEKVVTLNLPVNKKAADLTSTIFFNETMDNAWKERLAGAVAIEI